MILTVSLSDVLSKIQLLHRPSPPGSAPVVESAEVDMLRLSLEEVGSEEVWIGLLEECDLPLAWLEVTAEDVEEGEEELEDEEEEEDEEGGKGRERKAEGNVRDLWTWGEVREIQDTLLTVVDAASQHEQLVSGRSNASGLVLI